MLASLICVPYLAWWRRRVLAVALVFSLGALVPSAITAQCELPPAYAAQLRDVDLGCPVGEATTVAGAFQPFERGWMYWRGDTGESYVLVWTPFAHRLGVAAHDWTVYPDTFVEGESEDTGLVPPISNASEPRRGFGKVWREQLGGPEGRIKWAMAPETAVPLLVQPFERGLVLHSPGRFTTILKSDGTWLEPRGG